MVSWLRLYRSHLMIYSIRKLSSTTQSESSLSNNLQYTNSIIKEKLNQFNFLLWLKGGGKTRESPRWFPKAEVSDRIEAKRNGNFTLQYIPLFRLPELCELWQRRFDNSPLHRYWLTYGSLFIHLWDGKYRSDISYRWKNALRWKQVKSVKHKCVSM